MAAADSDKVFAGSIPKIYDTHLVPLIFEPYAADLAQRLGSRLAPSAAVMPPRRSGGKPGYRRARFNAEFTRVRPSH